MVRSRASITATDPAEILLQHSEPAFVRAPLHCSVNGVCADPRADPRADLLVLLCHGTDSQRFEYSIPHHRSCARRNRDNDWVVSRTKERGRARIRDD